MIEYCAAVSDDSDDFKRCISWGWWDAAIEFFNEHEDEYDYEPDADFVYKKDLCIVAVGVARNVSSLSELIRNNGRAATMLAMLEELASNHDDYTLECAEGFAAFDPKNEDKMRELAEDVAYVVSKWETKYDMKPNWFRVDDAVEITVGFAEACADCAAKIDLSGKLIRRGSRWHEPFIEGPTNPLLDLWQAAEVCGVTAPPKPGRVPR